MLTGMSTWVQKSSCTTGSRVMEPQPGGNFVLCKELQTVPIGLLPYLGDRYVQNSWQVVTKNVAVFKPAIN